MLHSRGAAGVGSARTFVVEDAEQGRVVGYHALAAGAVEHEEATAAVARHMPRHPIGVIVLARLAVDRSVQGRGLGAWLLSDALRRSAVAAQEIGVRAVLVHAIDDQARSFYTRFGLEPSPTDPLNLQITIKDVHAALRA